MQCNHLNGHNPNSFGHRVQSIVIWFSLKKINPDEYLFSVWISSLLSQKNPLCLILKLLVPGSEQTYLKAWHLVYLEASTVSIIAQILNFITFAAFMWNASLEDFDWGRVSREDEEPSCKRCHILDGLNWTVFIVVICAVLHTKRFFKQTYF